jgi:tetratricopeptide (TPR) repeat protein
MSNQETISAYLAGDLDLLEKVQIERKLNEDEDFAREFEEAREKLLMAKAVERAALKAELKETFSGRRASVTIRPLWVAGAALAAAAAVLLIFFLGAPPETQATKELAMGYLEPYPLPAQRGEDPLAGLRARAYEQYREGDFIEAEKSFEALKEEDFSVGIFHADCLSQIGEYAEAIDILRHLTQGSPRADAAQWRLALNLILAGQEAEAKTLLSEMASSNHYKAKEAQKLLEEME